MSDSTDSDTSDVKKSLMIYAKGSNHSQTMSFQSNILAPTRYMPFGLQRPRYAASVCDQQSIYYKRDTSPLSLHSESGLQNQCICNGRSRSPMSVRSIASNASVAEIVTAAFRDGHPFSNSEFKEIQRFYNQYMKKRFRQTREERSNRRPIRKAAHRRYGGDSGDASDSTLSSDDCRSIRSSRTTGYKSNRCHYKLSRTKITDFKRSLKDSNMLRDCTDNLKRNSFLNSVQYDHVMSKRNQFNKDLQFPPSRVNQSVTSQCILQKSQSLRKTTENNVRQETDSDEEEMSQKSVIENRTNNNLRKATSVAHNLAKEPLRTQKTQEKSVRNGHNNDQEEIPEMSNITNRPYNKLPVTSVTSQKHEFKQPFPVLSQRFRQPESKETSDTSQSLFRIPKRNSNNVFHSKDEITNNGIVRKDTNKQVQHTSEISQKYRFTDRGFALPSQRFRHKNASQPISLKPQRLQKVLDKTFDPEIGTAQEKMSASTVVQNESHINLQNTCSVSHKDQFGKSYTLPSQKFGLSVDSHSTSAKPHIFQKATGRNARHENDNKKERNTKIGNEKFNKPLNTSKNDKQLTDNIFALPQIPVRKSKSVKNKEISEESLPPVEKIILMSSYPPAEELVPELVNEKENEQHTGVEHTTTNLSMRPSFIKRKLFSQKVQIPESNNISSDELQENKETVQRGENRTRKLVTTQSCLNRDMDGEDTTFLDLIYKIVPQDRMNVTTATTKSINNKNNPDNNTLIDKTNALGNPGDRGDESDTYTDEEIFETYSTISEQNTQTTESAVKLQSQNTKQSSTFVYKPNKNTGLVKRHLKSFWDTTDESDMEPEPKKRRSCNAPQDEENNRGPAKFNNTTKRGQNKKKAEVENIAPDSKKETKSTKTIRKPLGGAQKDKQTKPLVAQNKQVCNDKNILSNLKQTKQVPDLLNSLEKSDIDNVAPASAQERSNTKLTKAQKAQKKTVQKVQENTKTQIEIEEEENYETKSPEQQKKITETFSAQDRTNTILSNLKQTKQVPDLLNSLENSDIENVAQASAQERPNTKLKAQKAQKKTVQKVQENTKIQIEIEAEENSETKFPEQQKKITKTFSAQDRTNTKFKKNIGQKVQKNTKSNIETEALENNKTRSRKQQQKISETCNTSTNRKGKRVNSSSESNIQQFKTAQVLVEKNPINKGRNIAKKGNPPIEKTNLVNEKMRHHKSILSSDIPCEPRRTRIQNPLYQKLSDMTPEPKRTRSRNPRDQDLSDISFSLISDKKLPNKRIVESDISAADSSQSPAYNTRSKRTIKIPKRYMFY